MSATRILSLRIAVAMSTLLLTACTSGKVAGLRDVPVSQITLAEPLVAEAKLAKRIEKLRADPSRWSELAGALAEQSMVHRKLQIRGWEKEAKQAASLLELGDNSSHSYFLTRRALCFALNADGQHGGRFIKPLLVGKWSDLNKAQIYNDLADMTLSLPPSDDYVLKGLTMRLRVAGPNSLEVAESLCSLNGISPTPPEFQNQICEALQLPKSVVSKFDDLSSNRLDAQLSHLKRLNAAIDGRRTMYRDRAAQIQEKVLGPYSLKLADSLVDLGESEKLRAVSIYERHFGAESGMVHSVYSDLWRSAEGLPKRREFGKKTVMIAALQNSGQDPIRRGYVYLKNALPDAPYLDRNDPVTVLYKSLGGNPPSMTIPEIEMKFDGAGCLLDVDLLSVSTLDRIIANTGTSFDSDLFRDHMWVNGWNGSKEVFSMELPTWGGEGTEVKVIGKGRIRFSQKGAEVQGQQEVDYQWNGKRFEAVAGKPSIYDSARVDAAIEEAVNGQAFYGLRGHHAVDHDLILQALNRADDAATELFRQGNFKRAAQRLRIMFELTSDLIAEASTGSPVLCEIDDSKDDIQKWIKAWTCKNAICNVNLTEAEWKPFLDRYLIHSKYAALRQNN